jgi:hypothetical protein
LKDGEGLKTMEAWLKCSLEDGMLPGEYAADVATLNAGRVSLFVWDQKAKLDEGLISVEVYDRTDGSVLVKLPAQPFEITSRFVRVSEREIYEV